ncbi:MAG TPA: class I SAM-dependent methyltransferase [Tepidisphaeraceae bacterium]|jgi:SAM-dependent methyltransferase|nr:class I SAM-dependent methyltransferase [Tepidisphaeraceae bacterium]
MTMATAPAPGSKKLGKQVKLKLRNLCMRFPKNVECNICHWSGRRFASDDWHPFTVCWKCRSLLRHRLLTDALHHIEGLSLKDLVVGKRILHFAPERLTTPLFKPNAASYKTADFMRDDVDAKYDLTNMPAQGDGSVDLLVCCDVLEHVPDHMQGMREIFRVLSPGGTAILTVPQKDGLEKTESDPSLTDPKERLRRFGQDDHLRIFGNDVVSLLESVGFKVRVIDEKSFSPELVKKHVLFPPVLSKHPLATNYRKVFFAKKPG